MSIIINYVTATNTYTKYGAWRFRKESSASEGVKDIIFPEDSLR